MNLKWELSKMSRTFRRKGYSRDRKHLFWEWINEPGCWSCMWIPLDPNDPAVKVKLAKYHSDSGSFMGNAPGWFCLLYQKTARQDGNRQLHHYMRNPEDLDHNTGFSVLIDPNHHRSATWSWW